MYHKTLIKFSFEEWVYLKKSYSKHFGVFMDILGYKNLVMEAEKNITEAVHIIDNIEQMIKRCIKDGIQEFSQKTPVDFNIEYVLFSDSLCIFVPIDEHEEGERLQRFKGHSKKFVENNFMRLWFLCRLIADIQLESLRYGIVYRGAISLGNHFHSNNITFSKALVDAYLAESQKAIYPRVIILDTPENDILELAPALYEYFDIRVVADEDYLIVDYLGKIIEFLGLLDADCDYIQWHKEIIEQGINNYAEDNSILSKYAWMMNYHHIRLAPIFGEKICIQQECRNKVKEKLGLHLADLIC